MQSQTSKRRRVERSPSPTYKLDDDDSYEPYVPVAQRRQEKLAKLSSLGAPSEKQKAKKQQEEQEEREDAEKEEERRKERARKERTLLMEAQEVHSRKAEEGAYNMQPLKQRLTRMQIPKRPNSRRPQRQTRRSWRLLRVAGS
jgi:ATP-dependent RNA helicase DDX41